MVCIYVNLEPLSRKLASLGIIESPANFRAFAQAFTANQPYFSIIDVGRGKERADSKIRGGAFTQGSARC